MLNKKPVTSDESKYFLTCSGKRFAFNIEKIKDICFISASQKSGEREITEVYGGEDRDDMEITSKIIREIKSQGDNQTDMIMYDLVKLFIVRLLENGEVVRDDFPMDFSTSLALNTMIRWNLLIEVE